MYWSLALRDTGPFDPWLGEGYFGMPSRMDNFRAFEFRKYCNAHGYRWDLRPRRRREREED